MAGGKRWIGIGIVVVVAAIAVVILAQGGDGGSSPLNAIAKAAEVTRREPGGHAQIEARITTSTGEGIAETGSMTFDAHGRAEGTLKAQGESTGKEVEITTISAGTKAYMSSDAFESLPDGKKWMEIDFSKAVQGQTSAAPTQGNSPQEGLKILERVDGVEKVGKETVNGVPTTHYTGTFPATEEVFGAKIDSSAPRVDVWVDAQDRVRRMKVVVTTSVTESEGPTHTEMTIDYTDFGRVPKIVVPASDEVFDATAEVESKVQEAADGD